VHTAGYVHGDLTTSNFILAGGDPTAMTVIDFGLSSASVKDEDRAVDLYVLERALISTHPELSDMFNELVLAPYVAAFGGDTAAGPTLTRLEKVRARGRKRSMVG
jgi:TP53 regulating kinase-like protein